MEVSAKRKTTDISLEQLKDTNVIKESHQDEKRSRDITDINVQINSRS